MTPSAPHEITCCACEESQNEEQFVLLTASSESILISAQLHDRSMFAHQQWYVYNKDATVLEITKAEIQTYRIRSGNAKPDCHRLVCDLMQHVNQSLHSAFHGYT